MAQRLLRIFGGPKGCLIALFTFRQKVKFNSDFYHSAEQATDQYLLRRRRGGLIAPVALAVEGRWRLAAAAIVIHSIFK